MTTTTPNITDLLHQLTEMAKQAEAQVQPAPVPDPKYVVTAEFVEVPKATIQPLLKEWRAAKKALDARKLALSDIEDKIKELMDGAEVLVEEETQQHLVESRVVVAQVFDTTKFKKEKPDVAAEYQRTRYSRGFRVL